MKTAIRVQKIVATVSVILFIGKLWAWYLTHSVAILTDALESIVNVIAGFIGLYSILLAAKPRDANHPYGHGKAEYISAAVEGVLILISGILILMQVINVLLHPLPLKRVDMGIFITAATGVFNYFLGVYALSVGRKSKSATVEAAGTHLKSDAYSTFAIIAGLVVVMFTGWDWLDQLIAAVFGFVIIVTGYRVLRKSLAGIMDEADEELLRQVLESIGKHRKDAWVDLHNFRGIQYGPVLHIDAHLSLPWYWNARQIEAEVNEIEAIVRQDTEGRVECFLHIDACKPYSCSICSLKDCPERQNPQQRKMAWSLEQVMQNSQHGKPQA